MALVSGGRKSEAYFQEAEQVDVEPERDGASKLCEGTSSHSYYWS